MSTTAILTRTTGPNGSSDLVSGSLPEPGPVGAGIAGIGDPDPSADLGILLRELDATKAVVVADDHRHRHALRPGGEEQVGEDDADDRRVDAVDGTDRKVGRDRGDPELLDAADRS